MSKIAYVSGKIETKDGQCMVGSQVVDCPNRSLSGGQTSTGTKLDLLPSNFIADTRNDTIFYSLFIAIILIFALLAIFKVKIFTKTLGEYLKPIWYFVIICLLAVAWQYLFGIKEDNMLYLRISQWIWELAIAFSVIQLVKKNNFNFGNIIFLAVLYSFIIHGLKVSIRYLFYEKTFLYILDRFIFGSLLVVIIVCGVGLATLIIVNSQKKINNKNQN